MISASQVKLVKMNRILTIFLAVSLIFLSCSRKTQSSKTNDMKPDAPLENTRWKLTKLPGMDALPPIDADVWVQFILHSSDFRGYAGCNAMNGTYQTLPGSKIRIGPVAMTRMICPDPQMKVEDAMTRAVNEADNFLIKGDHLALRKGKTVLAEFDALYLR